MSSSAKGNEYQTPTNKVSVVSIHMNREQEFERNEYIGDKYNQIFDQYMKKAKAKLDTQIRQDIREKHIQIDKKMYHY